jgi:hypothetical protein
MSHVLGRVCPFVRFGWLRPIGVALIVASMAHAVTINVPCSGSGGGASGLVATINTANSTPGPNTINLTPGCVYTLTSPYQADSPNGLPPITTTLTINGYGATIARSQAVGTPGFRIVAVLTGGNLALNTVTVRGGESYFDNCEVWDFYAVGHGGGLCVGSGGTVTLNRSTVTENTALGNEGFSDGGGIYNEGTVTLNYSIVSKNNASSNDFGHAQGGGIFNLGGLTLQFSTITHNSVNASSEDTGGAAGGGIASGGTLVMLYSGVLYNTVNTGAPFEAGGTGGGIAVLEGSTSTLAHSVIRNNSVTARGGIGTTTAAGGGNWCSGCCDARSRRSLLQYRDRKPAARCQGRSYCRRTWRSSSYLG